MSKNLFNEFEKNSSKIWKQKIQVDLKGADYNDTLIWHSNESVHVKPFYHPDEFNPELFPKSLLPTTSWQVGQVINVTVAKHANDLAKDALNRGAESIWFNIINTEVKFTELLKDLENIPATIQSHKPLKVSSSKHSILFDPLGHLASTGNWIEGQNTDFTSANEQITSTNQLILDGTFYQNAGANIVQQLAYVLAHLNEYLNRLDQIDSFDMSKLEIGFHMAVGGNYFFEIAKIRALRLLWQSLSKTYGANKNCSISTIPTNRNKSIYDYNVNMLRTTTECMSAILGGADVVYNTPYDKLYQNQNEFGDRISRNQLLILKHESYFDKVENPADGSYYIESLTQQLGQKALTIFKNIEVSGGFIEQLMSGKVQQKIKESAVAEQEQFHQGELVLLGVNTFTNDNDKMKQYLEIDPFLKKKPRKTLIEPIIQKRLSESLEKKRLHSE